MGKINKPGDIERIEFGDGQWWDIRAVVTRRMRKRFRKAGMSAITTRDGLEDVDFTDGEAVKLYITRHPEAIDLDALDDAHLLYGTAAWSFGDEITTATIDDLPDQYVSRVVSRMRELYAEADEETRADLSVAPSSTQRATARRRGS